MTWAFLLVGQTVACLGINSTYEWFATVGSSSNFILSNWNLQILEKRASFKATENPNRNLGNQPLVLSDAESGKGRKIGNVSLEVCIQILMETGRFENLIRIDNLVKVTESSSIYRQAPKPGFPHGRKSFKSLQSSQHLHIHQLPVIYKKVQKRSKKTNMSAIW